MTASIPPRAEIPEAFRWNDASLFIDLSAWETEFQLIKEAIAHKQIALPDDIEAGHQLHSLLDASYAWLIRVRKVFLYAALNHSVETTEPTGAQRYSESRALLSQVQSQLASLQPLLLRKGEETIKRWMAETPDLNRYDHFLEDIFRKQAHIRSGEIETLLGLLQDPFAGTSATTRMLTNADFQFEPAVSETGEPVDVTQGSHPRLMTDPDRSIRKTAWENYLDLYHAHRNTLATTLETSIKQNVLLSKVRGYTSTLEASLFEYQISTDIFHNLLEIFVEKLPLWHRYWRIRKDALGYEHLRPYDTWAPLTKEQPTVPYEQAVEWICAGLEPMGEEYVDAIRLGCGEQRWIDVYPNQGKRGGAFSSGVHGTHPFIVMSYNDTLFSLSTLAHELGHSMHSYLAWKNQPPVYGDYSLFVAEVASNFHQAMVRAYLLDRFSEAQFRIAVIEEAMANFYRYFLIMPTLARFELETHRRVEAGQGLTAELLKDLCVAFFEEAYGPDIKINKDRVGMIWSTFGHLYVDYYVYQYATGIAGASAISQKILSDDTDAVERYLSFLKVGGARYPIDALEIAGVDLSSAEPIHAAFKGMEQMIDELEALLGDV